MWSIVLPPNMRCVRTCPGRGARFLGRKVSQNGSTTMVAHPQLKVQLSQQSFKPASTPTGFRPHCTKHDKCSLRTKISHVSGGSFTDQTRNIVLAIVGVAAAVVVVVAVVAIHYSKKRAIAGCVSSAGSGMNVTDEKDKQTYA